MIFIPDDELDESSGSCCRRLRQNNAEELYAAIGYGGITIELTGEKDKKPDTDKKTCPQCGAPVSEDALFCNKCGAQL